MATYRIGVLNGDDIGLEIVPVAVRVLKTALARHPEAEVEWVPLPIGYLSFIEHGKSLLPEVLDTLYTLDGWILGPIGHMAYPKDPQCINPHPILRKKYDLVSNIRPAKAYPGVKCINPQTDLIIVRENNEGFQPDRNMYMGTSDCMPTPDMALSLRVVTRRNSSMAARTAFELARQRGGKKKVTAVHKANIMKATDGLFLRVAREVAANYPDIEFNDKIVDATCMGLVQNPNDFDVLVLPNLYGDIVSDLCAGLVGGLGMAPGSNIGADCAIFEATHGSAPDIAGQDIANPTAEILSAAMMLDHLGENDAANRIRAAVSATLDEGEQVTGDVRRAQTGSVEGAVGTQAFADAVIAHLA